MDNDNNDPRYIDAVNECALINPELKEKLLALTDVASKYGGLVTIKGSAAIFGLGHEPERKINVHALQERIGRYELSMLKALVSSGVEFEQALAVVNDIAERINTTVTNKVHQEGYLWSHRGCPEWQAIPENLQNELHQLMQGRTVS